MSLSASSSSDANGDALTYTWTAQNGQTLSGKDQRVVTFNAPESASDAQYTISLKVDDGKLSDTTSYVLNVRARAKTPDAGPGSYPSWSAGKSWKPGDIVLNQGALYQCKPFPAGGWCSVAPTYYEPGAGISWQDAWNAL